VGYLGTVHTDRLAGHYEITLGASVSLHPEIPVAGVELAEPFGRDNPRIEGMRAWPRELMDDGSRLASIPR
jgi:hypothetical protein